MDLYGVAYDSHEVFQSGICFGRVEYPVVVLGYVVGYDGFLDESCDDEPESEVEQTLRHGLAVAELREEVAGTCDRSC